MHMKAGYKDSQWVMNIWLEGLVFMEYMAYHTNI